jgi:hypothetical protein
MPKVVIPSLAQAMSKITHSDEFFDKRPMMHIPFACFFNDNDESRAEDWWIFFSTDE